MAEVSRADLLSLALGVLPQPPASIDVISEDGGSFRAALDGAERDLLRLYAPRTTVRKQLRLMARITDEARGGYEVEFEIVEVFFHSGAEALAHVAVTDVRRRKMRRLAPRVSVAAKATGTIVFCRSLAAGAEIDVRLADVSTSGVAFSSRQPLDAGDLLDLRVILADRPMSIGLRVVRCDPAPYSRFRIGCEITELGERDRSALAALADESGEQSSVAERRPDAQPALRGGGGLGLMGRIGSRNEAA
jgi:hypothetical protein